MRRGLHRVRASSLAEGSAVVVLGYGSHVEYAPVREFILNASDQKTDEQLRVLTVNNLGTDSELGGFDAFAQE